MRTRLGRRSGAAPSGNGRPRRRRGRRLPEQSTSGRSCANVASSARPCAATVAGRRSVRSGCEQARAAVMTASRSIGEVLGRQGGCRRAGDASPLRRCRPGRRRRERAGPEQLGDGFEARAAGQRDGVVTAKEEAVAVDLRDRRGERDVDRPDARCAAARPAVAGKRLDLRGFELARAPVGGEGPVEHPAADVRVDGLELHAEPRGDLPSGEDVALHQRGL